jgi:hypothetical protein
MKGKIALFLNHPKCSVQSGNGIIKALDPYYHFKIFTKHDIESNFFDDVDIVCFPGGVGDMDSFSSIHPNTKKLVKNYVRRGGKYLGICMGAYWADMKFFNILDNVRVDQYIRQPNVNTRRPHAKAMPVVWRGVEDKMFFFDGCTYIGNKFKTIASYETGHPMAIIQNNVGLIACHLESEKYWYDDYTWMPKHWHNYRHQKLLVEFVDTLQKS